MQRRSFIALFAVLISGCSSPNDFLITTTTQADKILALTVTPSTAIPADGVSLATIRVSIDPSAKTNDRTLTLTTTAGSFVGAGSNGQLSVTVDALGQATALLQAPSTPATAIVHVGVTDFSRNVNVIFRAAEAGDLFTVTPSSKSAAVNATPGIALQVALKFVGTASQETVAIKTSLGTLVAPGTSGNSVTLPADLSGNALVYLQSSNVGTAQVQITVNGFTQYISITFTAN